MVVIISPFLASLSTKIGVMAIIAIGFIAALLTGVAQANITLNTNIFKNRKISSII